MTERMIKGLSHSRGTGLTWEQMKALDAERRRLDANALARRVEPASLPPAPPAPPPTRARPESGAQAPATASSTPTGGPRVIEVGKALRSQAEARARAERLDALEQALDTALNQQQRFSQGGQ